MQGLVEPENQGKDGLEGRGERSTCHQTPSVSCNYAIMRGTEATRGNQEEQNQKGPSRGNNRGPLGWRRAMKQAKCGSRCDDWSLADCHDIGPDHTVPGLFSWRRVDQAVRGCDQGDEIWE